MSVRVESKAARLLTSGAVTVFCDDGRVLAVVRGDHGTYQVEAEAGRQPSCSCPSWRRRCSHALAVSLVTGGGVP